MSDNTLMPSDNWKSLSHTVAFATPKVPIVTLGTLRGQQWEPNISSESQIQAGNATRWPARGFAWNQQCFCNYFFKEHNIWPFPLAPPPSQAAMHGHLFNLLLRE